jgi:hypothetical protein
MVGWDDHEEVHPKEKKYSVVALDPWKAPDDDDFVYKIKEIDSLDEGPDSTSGKGVMRGESIIVLDQDGNSVSLPTEEEDSEETA